MLFIRHLNQIIKPLKNVLLFPFPFNMNCRPLVYVFKTFQLTQELICSVSSMFILKHSSVIPSHNFGELTYTVKRPALNYLSVSNLKDFT